MENETREFNILIVDDTPKNLQVLGNTLKQKNYKVEFAIDGKKALDWMQKQDFDLILLDVMMPGMDGYEVCQNIRTNENYNKIPIIFLTAKTDTESVIKGFEIGAQDYITKPFNTKELLARVKTQLELKMNREKLESVNQWLENEVQQRTLELEKANKELASLDKAKTDFLNIISHEIRTPLNGILGTLHLLKDRVDSEDMVNLVNLLDESVNRLEKFSFIALHITSLRTKKHKLNIQEIKLPELIEFGLIEQSQNVKDKKLTIDNTNSGIECMLYGDYDLLLLAVSKIIENAIKHSPAKGKISVTTYEDEKSVFLEITDQGKGFPDKIIEKGFDLFMTGEDHVNKNSGLDLNLVKLIIEVHNGKVEVYNLEYGGAGVKLSMSKNLK